MIKPLIGTLLVFWYLFNQVASDVDGISMDCKTEQVNFQQGEIMVYQLFYNWKFVWIPAGEVEFKVTETDSTYDLFVTGITYESYENFFKVEDYYRSSIDKETLLPIFFRRDISEGSYVRYDSIDFNYQDSTLIEYIGKNKNELKPHVYQMEDCTLDLVSLVYKLRNLKEEEIKKNINMNLFFDKELYDLDLRFLGEEKKKVKSIGTVSTLKYSPEVVVGDVFTEKDKMDMWITNDENRIPVMIESPIYIGSVKAILKSYENLSHPTVLPALIDN